MQLNTYKKHLLRKGSTIREALARLNILAKDAIIFVVTDDGKLVGSLTDGDVRRGLLKGLTIENTVDDVIQPSPRFIRKGERNIDKVIEYREKNYRVIPILDKNDVVINVINFRKLKSYLPVDSVIMAGGQGKRLRPLTDTMPKPLLKVGDKSILEHNLDHLTAFGINDFWISINYLGEQIESYFGKGEDKNINIKYLREKKPLGTIGAISKIKNFQHEYILVTNSDLLTNLNYEHFFQDFLKQDADFAVLTIPYQISVPYAVLKTSNRHVIDLKEKPTYTYYSNGGVYFIKINILDFIPKNTFYNTTDLMEDLIKRNKKIISYPWQGYWLDIGNHEDLKKAKRDIKRISFD